MRDFEQEIKDFLELRTSEELREMWNRRCEVHKYHEDVIEYNDPNELFVGCTPFDILNQTDLEGNYKLNDAYCASDRHGEYVSFDYVTDDKSPYDEDELIKFLMDSREDFCYIDLEEIFEAMDEDEDSEEE